MPIGRLLLQPPAPLPHRERREARGKEEGGGGLGDQCDRRREYLIRPATWSEDYIFEKPNRKATVGVVLAFPT